MSFIVSEKKWNGIRWSTLKAILDNKIVASTYVWIILLPIIMNATSKLPRNINIFPWGSVDPVTISLEIPVNWYSLYFSALIFALARILYIYKCPEFLRKYSSASDATSKGITAEIVWDKICDHARLYNIRTLKDESEEKKSIIRIFQVLEGRDEKINSDINKSRSFEYISKMYHITDKPGTGLFTFIRDRDFQTPIRSARSPDRSSNLLIWRFIELQDIYSPLFRMITALFTLVGVLLLLIPVCQGLYHVAARFLITFSYF